MSKEMRQYIDNFRNFLTENSKKKLNISDVSSSFTSWDMYNAFYSGRAVGANTDEDTRFQDLVMKYETFDEFLKEYQNSKK